MALSWFQFAVVISCISCAQLAGANDIPDDGLQTFSTAGSKSATLKGGDVPLLPENPSFDPTGSNQGSSHAPPSRAISLTQTETPGDEDTSANADGVAYAAFEESTDDPFDWPSAEAKLDVSVENPNSGDTDDNTEWITRKSSSSSNTVTVLQAVVEQEPGQEPKVHWTKATAFAETEGTVCTGSGEGQEVQDCLKEGSTAKSQSYTVAQSGEDLVYLH